jgi:hypothetical protein
MKGVVFTEFLELVESKFSLEMFDRIIEKANLPSGGIYTAVGTYDHDEIVSLVSELSNETDVPVPDLLKIFGDHMFGQFHVGYPVFFEGIDNAFDFLAKVEDYIHVEVKKLYPDAELPSVKYEMKSPDEMVVFYKSVRPMADLAEGLITGCIAHYGHEIEMVREDLDGSQESNFTLKRVA